MEAAVQNRLAIGVLGLAGGITLIVARRSRRLRRLRPLTSLPPVGVVGAIATTLFGLTAVILVGQGIDDFAIGRPWGAWTAILTGIAVVPAALWFAHRTILDVRKTGGGGSPAIAQA